MYGMYMMRNEELEASGVEKKKEADLCLVEQVVCVFIHFGFGLCRTPTALHV